jgi:hypothetical protein
MLNDRTGGLYKRINVYTTRDLFQVSTVGLFILYDGKWRYTVCIEQQLLYTLLYSAISGTGEFVFHLDGNRWPFLSWL